jgi:hypothetical protein
MGPALGPPRLDCVLVSLSRPTLRLLTAPAQAAKYPPHVTGMIVHPEVLLNYLTYSAQGPQVVVIAVRQGSFFQQFQQLLALLCRKFRFATRMGLRLQSFLSGSSVSVSPTHYGAWPSAHDARDLLDSPAFLQQGDGPPPTSLQFRR